MIKLTTTPFAAIHAKATKRTFIALALLSFLFWSSLLSAQEAASPVKNSSFEADQNGDKWPDDWEKPASGAEWVKEDTGSFIRFTCDQPGATSFTSQTINIPAGSTAIEVRWKQRLIKLQRGSFPGRSNRVKVEFINPTLKELDPTDILYTQETAEGSEWTTNKMKFLVPTGTTSLKISPGIYEINGGSMDIDELLITSTDAAPIQTSLASASKKRSNAAANTSEDGFLSNGNFETATNNNWPDHWGGPGNGRTYEKENGNSFIRLKSQAPDQMLTLYRVVDIPTNVKAVELSWRERVTDLVKGKQPWFDARIIMEFKDAAGNKLSQKPNPPRTPLGVKDWFAKSTKFLVPAEAVSLEIMPALFQVKSGTMDIDDIQLKAIDPEPILATAREADEIVKMNYVPLEEPNMSKWPKEIKTKGNRLVDPSGKEVWLQGVNAGGLESLATDKQPLRSVVVGVDDWKSNVIRLPVKGEFWFGKHASQKDGGKEYRERVDFAITLAANRGAYVVLDLHHFRAPRASDVEFWKDAATRYKNHPALIFDLFNEPHEINWDVWKNGGFVGDKTKKIDESAFLSVEEIAKNVGFESVGMQALVNAVREVGAKNVLLVAGLTWSSDLSQITKGYALDDKGGNGIMYSWHIYNWHKGWEELMMATAQQYPILVGECGADVNKMHFIPANAQEDPYTWVPDMLGFIQKHRLNWTGWCLHPKATPVMISDWKYTPTPFWGVPAKEAISGKQFELKKMR